MQVTIRTWENGEFTDKVIDALPTDTPGLVVHRGQYGGFVLTHAASGLRAGDFGSDIWDCAQALGELGDWTATPDKELLARAGKVVAAYGALPNGSAAPYTVQVAELERQGLPVVKRPPAARGHVQAVPGA